MKIINAYFYSRIAVPGEVEVKKPVTRNENGTTITWDHLSPVCNGTSPHYFLNFTNKDLSVYTRSTTSNSLSCGSECINATNFTIWAVIEDKIGTAKSHTLPPIEKGEFSSKMDCFSRCGSRKSYLRMLYSGIFPFQYSTFQTLSIFNQLTSCAL